jgi:hypothetical protein
MLFWVGVGVGMIVDVVLIGGWILLHLKPGDFP